MSIKESQTSGKHTDLSPQVENDLPVYNLLERFIGTHCVAQWDCSIGHNKLSEDGTQHVPPAQKKPHSSDKDGIYVTTSKLMDHVSAVKFSTRQWCLMDMSGRW